MRVLGGGDGVAMGVAMVARFFVLMQYWGWGLVVFRRFV